LVLGGREEKETVEKGEKGEISQSSGTTADDQEKISGEKEPCQVYFYLKIRSATKELREKTNSSIAQRAYSTGSVETDEKFVKGRNPARSRTQGCVLRTSESPRKKKKKGRCDSCSVRITKASLHEEQPPDGSICGRKKSPL